MLVDDIRNDERKAALAVALRFMHSSAHIRYERALVEDAMRRAAEKPAHPRVRIVEGWEGAGRIGTALAQVVVGQCWTVVQWDDDPEDPDLFKTAGLKETT